MELYLTNLTKSNSLWNLKQRAHSLSCIQEREVFCVIAKICIQRHPMPFQIFGLLTIESNSASSFEIENQ